jgi:hypothetical protein
MGLEERARYAADAWKDIQTTMRVKFDIEIRAPVIIVPQFSKSNEAFLADFGTYGV